MPELPLPEPPPRAPRTPKPKAQHIPKLPPIEISAEIIAEASTRGQACVNLRLEGVPWPEVVKLLDFADVVSAQQTYYATLASMHPQSNWEVLRQEAALRAEAQFRRSFAMAGAETLLVTVEKEDGTTEQRAVPNTDRLRWHEQANKDLALLVNITGAKAPARLEVTASTAELNQMVQVLLASHAGAAELEADVFDLDELPAEVVD